MIPGKKKLSAFPVRRAKKAAMAIPINPETTCCKDCRRSKRKTARIAAVPTDA
jgi:hypothetical protein